MSKYIVRPLLFQIQPVILRRLCQETPKMSNTERPPRIHQMRVRPTSVDHDGIDVPDFVHPAAFRQFSGPDEQLGPGAGKSEKYKNGHYFGYHRFSFHELQTQAIDLRNEMRLDCGLQASIEADGEKEELEKELGTMKKLEEECDEILAAQAKEIEAEEKALEEMTVNELEEWCLKKEAEIKEKEKEKEKMQLLEKEKLEEMTVDELEEWCLKKEAAIKEKEKANKEMNLGEKTEKKIQEMSEQELLDWCLKKEADIKENVKKEADQAKKDSEPEAEDK
ncbi:vicilin-like seed storage protein At2g18540 [Drosophila serrata]|uniref:vicilin-like seed storage protein At2g18540 n=1 Tax=Drosophila serrata TaxID=7274 RepID=UPI000A1D2932|nr:vicilin-like seed storage protein At2g18540 [Drosophila serrata]